MEHPRMLVPRVLYNWEKQNCGRMSSTTAVVCLDEVQILIFDDSAMEKPSQRPRSGLSPARVHPFTNITTSFFRGTRVLHQKSHSHR